MPRHAAPLPAALTARPFTLAEARALSVPDGRLRRSDIRRIGPSLYAPRMAEHTEADLVEAVLGVHPEAVACGLTAARLWGLPLPLELATWRPVHPIEISAPGSRRRSHALILWRRLALEPSDITIGDRIRCTSPERTFIDVGPRLRHEDAVALGDALVRTPRPDLEGRDQAWTTLERLRAGVEAHRGRGRAMLRERVGDVRVGADSAPESFLRLAATRAGLPEPVPNKRIVVDGTDLGVPDLQWADLRVCAEHEGPHHRTPEQQERDIRRSERRRRAGWIEVCTTAVDLRDGCRRAVERYRQALQDHGWSGPERE